MPAPSDADARRAVQPVVCYPPDTLPPRDVSLYATARATATKVEEVTVPPREARCFSVPAGHFFRITSVEGPQVGDLNDIYLIGGVLRRKPGIWGIRHV